MQFAEILKGADAEGKEKHVPTIEIITNYHITISSYHNCYIQTDA